VYLFDIFWEQLLSLGEPTHTTSKQGNGTKHPNYMDYHLKSQYPRCFVVSYVQPFIQQHNSTAIKKITSAIKVVTMKITDDFCYKWKPARAYQKIATFHCMSTCKTTSLSNQYT